MSRQQTEDALMARAIPSDRARELTEQGYNLKKLQAMQPSSLSDLGLSAESIEMICKGRPSILSKTLQQLLHDCKRTCCVCRDSRKSVIVHHIKPWAETRNHDESNLVVLCCDHHSEAHTTKELAQNLTPDELMYSKQRWLEEVKSADTEALFTPHPHIVVGSVWDHFNHTRLEELAKQLSADPESCRYFTELRQAELLTESGGLTWPDAAYAKRADSHYMYDGILPRKDQIYAYFRDLLFQVVSKTNWVNLREIWSKTKINALVQPGTMIVLTGNFRFKPVDRYRSSSKGPQQNRIGYYHAHGIELSFTFDAWETTANSASGHLSGNWVCTCICLARSLQQESKTFQIKSTCLGLGTGFTDYSGYTPTIALIKEEQSGYE
jgi:hypothetical protein